MGTGKSTIGRNLSKTFGYPLVDTDQLIVEQ
ncbi:shikimate kinase, partial [Akkermansiaceae bacterium]|nr:shikimate kinase [Akkermansiaceae bacterium]